MGILDKLAYDTAVADKKTYEKELADLQLAVLKAELRTREAKRAVVIGFEGWDAAGKGGAIKRLTEKLDPRGYQVHAIGAPSDEEKKHHYLWRFWTHMPDRGRWGIFDRTWYGRVLVERVEKLAPKPAWKRAYDEINAFERTLTADGVRVVKFFLHIDRKTQLKRFQDRETDPVKRYKLGPEDWRNRKKAPAYEDAIADMLDRTHRPDAPWIVVPSNDKRAARLQVLQAVIDLLEGKLP
jgi:polyphosphate kinase 2 (PPK2 family)